LFFSKMIEYKMQLCYYKLSQFIRQHIRHNMRTSNHMSYKINNFCKTFAHFYHKLNKMGAHNTPFCPIYNAATDK